MHTYRKVINLPSSPSFSVWKPQHLKHFWIVSGVTESHGFFIQVIAWRTSIFFKISDAHYSLCISITVIMFCSCNLRNFCLVAWIMPWSTGCNTHVMFGGKNWSFTLLYSTVGWDDALSKNTNTFLFQMPSYGLTSSTRFQILLMSFKHFCFNITLQIIVLFWYLWSSVGFHISILLMA